MTITAQCRFSERGFTHKALYEFKLLKRYSHNVVEGENNSDFIVRFQTAEFLEQFTIKEITHD